MTDKPGMHQVVERKGVNFDAIIAKMVQAKPRAAFPLVGWGKKCFIEATLKKKEIKVVVEIFSEVTFGASPVNPEVGYTKDEANIFQGVCVTDYKKKPDTVDDYHPSQGEVMKYEDFAKRYIVNSITRVTLERVMEDMTDALIINEQMLDRINSAWGNRDPGERELFSLKYN